MQLKIEPKKIEYIIDENDTNAIFFYLNGGNFSIQTSVYEHEIEELNQPYFEIDDQANSMYITPNKIVFFNDKITIHFDNDNLLLGDYSEVEISLLDGINKKIVDFFSDYLFLDKYICYSDDFDQSIS